MIGSSNPTEPAFSKVACDQCHRCKLRCTRELPRCERCSKIGSHCTFSTGKPIGKPRGSKNKNPRRLSLHRRMNSQTNVGRPLLGQTHSESDAVWFPAGYASALAGSQGSNQDSSLVPPSSSDMSFLVGEGSESQDQSTGRGSLGSLSTSDSDVLISPSIDVHTFPQAVPFSPVIDTMMDSACTRHTETHAKSRTPGSLNDVATDAAGSLCTCQGLTGQYVLSLLHEAQHQPSASVLDSSLYLLRNTLQLCERSLGCRICRRTTGALLFMSLIQRTMSYYGKLLSEYCTLPSSNSSGLGVDVGAVVVGGLEITSPDLQGKIVEAVIRSEMKAGLDLLTRYEQLLSNDYTGRRGKLPAAEAQLASALREEFNKY